MPVYCEDCDHLDDDRRRHPRYWMCRRHQRHDGFGFVTHAKWDRFDPYMYAADINGGNCPDFKPKPQEQD